MRQRPTQPQPSERQQLRDLSSPVLRIPPAQSEPAHPGVDLEMERQHSSRRARRETARRKAKRAGILAMYADQFAQSLVTIANDGRKKPLFDAETIASKIRDSITGFETVEDQEETETDALGTDLIADITLDDDLQVHAAN